VLTRLLPNRRDYTGIGRTWRADVVAGLTVAVVALPLALGFGITSGMGAGAGLVTAVVAGLVAAVFGGSNLQVSGPTGAMTVVLVPIVDRYGVDAVFTVGLVAGAIVVLAGVLRLGRSLAYVPWPVVEGFTVGIAAIIVLQQVPAALGVAKPEGENTLAVAVRAVGDALGGAGSAAAPAIVLLVAAVLVVLPRLHRALPASLLAVGIATVVAEVADLGTARIGELPSSLPTPSLPSLSFGRVSELLGASLAVAALAAIESLLSARVADGMIDAPRHDSDRELLGQGLANVASSLFGGMPATGAIARTAVNARAGARTRLASGVHAVALLGVVLLAGSVVAKVPIAALAGVLVVTGVRMVERHNVAAVVPATRADAAVLVLTAVATIAFDLIAAIEIGLAVAAVLALGTIARSAAATPAPVPAELDLDDEHRVLREQIVTYRLDGALFFGAAQRFLTELTNVTDVAVVILRMPALQVLDATGAQALGEIVEELEDRGITVLIKGARPQHLRVMEAVGVVDRLAHDRHVFDDLPGAVEHARRHVARRRAVA